MEMELHGTGTGGCSMVTHDFGGITFEDETGELPADILLYICVKCFLAFQNEERLSNHKQNKHGLPKSSRQALILSKTDLNPSIRLIRHTTIETGNNISCSGLKVTQNGFPYGPRPSVRLGCVKEPDVDLLRLQHQEDNEGRIQKLLPTSLNTESNSKEIIQTKPEQEEEANIDIDIHEEVLSLHRNLNQSSTTATDLLQLTPLRVNLGYNLVKPEPQDQFTEARKKKSSYRIITEAEVASVDRKTSKYMSTKVVTKRKMTTSRKVSNLSPRRSCRSSARLGAGDSSKKVKPDQQQSPAASSSSCVAEQVIDKNDDQISDSPDTEQHTETNQVLGLIKRENEPTADPQQTLNPKVCPICKKTFESVRNRKEHEYRKHGGDKLCQYCEAIFKKKELFQHQLTCNRYKCYQCTDQQLFFKYKADLIKHQRAVHCLKCPHCHKTYKALSHYEEHLRVHTGEKPHRCEVCTRSFNCRSNLYSHMYVLHGILRKRQLQKVKKSFECPICAKPFKLGQERTLEQHILTHSNEKPFKCNICDAGFRFKSVLTTHMKVVHVNERNFQCEECGQNYKSKIGLGQHLFKVHKRKFNGNPVEFKKFPCEVCGKEFFCVFKLKYHKGIHDPTLRKKCFQCENCGDRFALRHHLRNHLKTHIGKNQCQ